MIPLVSIYPVGPYIFPAAVALVVALTFVAGSLIDAGLARRGLLRWLCLGLGIPLAAVVSIAVLMVVFA